MYAKIRRLPRRAVPMLAALLCLGLCSAPAVAATNIDARGTWDCTNTAGGTCQFTIDTEDASGAYTGRGAGNGYTWPVTGTISGNSFTMKHGPYDQGSYVAYFAGTLSDDGNTMTGNYGSAPCDANPCTSPFTYTRVGGPTPTPTATATATVSPTPTPTPGKRAAASVVACDLYNAEQPNAVFLCTASVGDASGQTPAKVPTGTASFTIDPGGSGSYLGNRTASCSLTPSPSSPNVSFCSVNYVPPAAGIPIGSQPPITMTYAGDATFGPSAAKPLSRYGPCPPANLQTRAVAGPRPVATDVTPAVPTCAQAARLFEQNADSCASAANGSNRIAALAHTSVVMSPNMQFNVSQDSVGTTLLKIPAQVPRALAGCACVLSYGVGGLATVASDGRVLTAQTGVGAVMIVSGVGSAAGAALEVSAAVQYTVGQPVARGMNSLGSTLLNDPPDKHYRSVAKVPRIRAVALPRKTPASTRQLAAFATATQRFRAAAKTMQTAVNRAGGAKQAHKKHFQGKQIRAALADGKVAVRQLNRLISLEPKIAAQLLTATTNAPAVTADQVAKAAHAKLPAVDAKLLEAYGMSASAVRAAMKGVKVGDKPSVVSLSPFAVGSFRSTAAVIRLYARMPQIRKLAKLK